MKTKSPLDDLFVEKMKGVDGQKGYVRYIALCRILVELELLVATTEVESWDVDFSKRKLGS